MRKGKEVDLLLLTRAKARAAVLASYPTDTASGSLATFPDGGDGVPVKSLTVNISAVQAGSGDPGPDNIRPISGFTGATVTRVGKNLFPPYIGPATAGGVTMTPNKDGSFALEGTASATAFTAARTLPFPVASGTNVSFRLGNDLINSEVGLRVIWSEAGGTTRYGTLYRAEAVDQTAEGVAASFAANRVQTVVASNHGDVTKITLKPQLELGDKATAWEPYTEETVTVSWDAEAGTVYGGSLDLTAGVLTVTEGYIAAYDGEELPGKWISDRDVYAEGTSPSTGAQVVYTLAEPLTYRLASGALHTVLGVNHIFSDAGAVEVEYRADLELYIEKRIGEGGEET